MAIRKPTIDRPKTGDLYDLFNAALSGQSVKFAPGSIVKGRISAIKGSDVFVNIGYKSEGTVSTTEFKDPEAIQVGAEIDVFLQNLEDEKTGMVAISKRMADEKIRWEAIIGKYAEGAIVRGAITGKVRGGLTVQIEDVEAFLPGSQIDLIPVHDADGYIGQTFEFKVIKISNERKNIIVSRRELLEDQQADKKRELLAQIEKGQIRRGRVKNITDFGAFIDLTGMDGLLHITDMSWGRIKHPSELLKVGQELDVMVLDVDLERERVSLGLKQAQPNPWDGIESRYPVGSRLHGKVVNLVAYGAFVELEPGIEGLVHVSEFSWTKRIARASDVLSVGDEVDVVVLSINSADQKIALGIRQTEANPWDTVQDRYPVGSRVTGKVRNFTTYGAFVEMEEGIDGMIHVSDMSWTRKINHPSEVLQKGQTVEAVVLEIDPAAQRISLGLKQATEDPWSTIASRYAIGQIVKGKVSKIASFGAFVSLEDGVDGLVHISQISDQHVEKVKDALKVGQEVEARIVKIDRDERRIGLSIRAVSMDDSEVEALARDLSATDGGENLGGLASAFNDAFAASEEWRPGDDSDK
ncbi:MAG: 30S ribosomal protein S1 [Kiritimatiellia bacterium]|nr:30S ribosomal protein S1 [Kiritimatiellia bacterium]